MKPNKKKRHKLPKEKSLDYALLIFLLTILVFWITLATTSHSVDKYSGKTNGEVTDIFYVMPNRAGNWTRRVEVSFFVNGQMHKIHIDSPASIQIGDSCKVRYRSKRPSYAFVEWY